MGISSRTAWILIALTVIIFGITAFTSLMEKSPVRDEPVHWAFGYGLLNQDDETTLQRGVGPVSVLNVLAGGGDVQGMRDPSSRTRSRIPTVIIGMILILGVAIFAWQLYGPTGAVFAALLAAFEPNIIAHSRWVTTDLAVTVGIFFTVLAAWWFSRKPGMGRAALTGAALGLTLLAKVSGLILLPLIPIFWFAAFLALRKQAGGKQKSPMFWLGSLLLVSLAAWLVLNTGFGWAGTMTPLGDFTFNSTLFNSVTAHLPAGVPVPLPALFTRCLDHSFWFTELGHPVAAYLNGQFSHDGFSQYYVIAFTLKSTLGFLGVLLLTLLMIRKKNLHDDLFLILPVILFFGYFSVFNDINIGLRYILPIYPLLCVAAGRIVARPKMGKPVLAAAVILLLLHMGASLSVWPHYLEYFNRFAGGPGNGYRYLSDSNLDWGQDRELLQNYLALSSDPVTVNPQNPGNGRIAVNTNRIISGKYAWLKKYKPVDRVAYTWFIYDITGQDRDLAPPENQFKGLQGITERLIGPDPNKGKPGFRLAGAFKDANLLVITVDTLRADHLGSFGHRLPTSPWMDMLSRRGYLFMDTRCQIPRTTPSHSCLFTGLYPGSHGSTMNCQPISDGIPTLATLLKTRNYRTGAVVSSAVISAKASGLNQGFDFYEDATGSQPPASPTPLPVNQDQLSKSTPVFNRKILFAGGMGEMQSHITPYERLADTGTDLALDWLRTPQETPFFFWMHYFDPHSSYMPPGIFQNLFAGDYSPRGTVVDVLKRHKKGLPLNLDEINRFHGQYDGEIRFVDRQISRILDLLARDGRLDNTIIVLTADHGETLGEYQGYVGHGEHLNDGSVLVPLIVVLPDHLYGRIIRHPVQTIDIMPTILTLLGLPAPENLQGRPLLPELSVKPDPPQGQAIFMQSAVSRTGGGVALRVACSTDRFKYIGDITTDIGKNHIDSTKLTPDALKDFALYNLVIDPGETMDVRDTHPETLQLFRKSILEWLQSQRGEITARDEITDENRKILEALGYLQ